MLVFRPSEANPPIAYVRAPYESYRFSCTPAMRRHFRAISDLVWADRIETASVAALDFEAIRAELEET